MIAELSRSITAAMREVQLTSTNTTKLRKKLQAAVVDPLLPSMTLHQVSTLAREGHLDVLDHVLRDMTLKQLTTVSKKWNPHRKVGADVIMRDIQIELRDLVAGRRGPALDPTLPASWSLLDARERYAKDQRLIDEALGAMSLAQMKTASKCWNPHRLKIDRDIGADELRTELRALLTDRLQPASKPPTQERALSRSRRGSTIRTKLVAAE